MKLLVFISEQAYTQAGASLQGKQGPSLTGTGLQGYVNRCHYYPRRATLHLQNGSLLIRGSLC